MKIEKQSTDDLRELAQLVQKVETCMLTSIDQDGFLVSRPLQTLALNRAGELVFFTSAKSAKVAQLTEDRHVNLAYVDSDNRRYLSVRGRARMDRDSDTIDTLWSMEQKVFFPAGKNDPELMVLRVKVHDAMYWDAEPGSLLGRALEFAQSMASEEPDDLGTRQHLSGS